MVSFRPIPFVLAATNHGTMILNRNDYCMVGDDRAYGVGYQIFNTSSCEQEEVSFVVALLNLRRKYFGNGVIGLDCGANIGVHTIEWAKQMHNWGKVIAFEAQERIYYALAGNIAINNCLNTTAHLAAVGSENGTIKIPVPDYLLPASFGSLELKQSQNNEFIGQNIDYSDAAMSSVQLKTIDSFNLPRVDLIKIDVEGMEVDVLNGAAETIKRCKPIMTIEIIKTDKAKVEAFLAENGYQFFPFGINILAFHQSDEGLKHITTSANGINLVI
jgi:FkbM family methyltransferase